LTETLLVISILLLSTITFSYAGFGFSMLSVPLLALIYPAAEAITFQFIYALFLVFYQAYFFRGKIIWKIFLPLAIGALICMPIGAYALQAFSDQLLKRCLSIFLLFAVAINRSSLGRKVSEIFKNSHLWGLPFGALSGIIQGAYTTGGPPAVVYVRIAVNDPAAAKSILGLYFSLIYLFMLPVLALSGLFSEKILIKSLLYSPVVIIGIIAGAILFNKKGKNENYRFIVDILLLIAAILLWNRA
jgi:uncharacterized protein